MIRIERLDMSTTKLTLSADKNLIELARKIAKQDGVSISAAFTGYIMARAKKGGKLKIPQGPLTRKLGGMVKTPKGWNERKALETVLAQKYGLNK
jgi:hypothetical protein